MADTNTTPQERIRIFSRDGFPVAEFKATVERSWIIGDEARGLFVLPSRKTDMVNERVLQYGNWLLVESTALPPWVGVIDIPRRWSARDVTIHAYTPERVFKWRRGPVEAILNGSAGAIFEQLLAYVNQAQGTIIRAGNLWKNGAQTQLTVNPSKLSEDLKRLQKRGGEEYQWRPSIDANGRLVVYADWLSRVGVDTSALLHEGKGGGNLETISNIFVEDGPIVNDVLAYGDGETWSSKPMQTVTDNASIGNYGLRQEARGYSGVIDLQTLANNASTHLAQYKSPLRTFRLNALNVGDTFRYMQVGNRMRLRLESVGFYGSGGQGLDTAIRIIGMAYDPGEKNQVNLVVEEVILNG